MADLPYMSNVTRGGTMFKFFKRGMFPDVGFFAKVLILDRSIIWK